VATHTNHDESSGLAVRGAAYVESFVSLIRDRALRPILVGARFAILGLIGLGVVAVVAIAIVVGLVRLFTSDVFGGRVWATDLLFGGIFLGSGVFLVSRGLRGRGGKNDE
jgi:hypothetical protein